MLYWIFIVYTEPHEVSTDELFLFSKVNLEPRPPDFEPARRRLNDDSFKYVNYYKVVLRNLTVYLK